jgi:hypothetical protein
MPSVLYEIVVRGAVATGVLNELVGFEVVSTGRRGTVLRGWVTDQSALHAILNRVASFGLELNSVAPVEVLD